MTLPLVDAPREALDTHDFAPFKALCDLPMGMTAHLVYDAIDPRPATLSPVMMNLIREDIGFDNLIMTDDISMKALAGEVNQIAADALSAGCDVVLYCNATLADRAPCGRGSRRNDRRCADSVQNGRWRCAVSLMMLTFLP